MVIYAIVMTDLYAEKRKTGTERIAAGYAKNLFLSFCLMAATAKPIISAGRTRNIAGNANRKFCE
jgi:hypothetical protein